LAEFNGSLSLLEAASMRILLPSILLAFAAAFPALATAQSISLRPAVVPLKGELGQSVTQTLTLQNDSTVPLEFEIIAQDVVVRDGKRVFVEAGQLPGSVAASAVINPTRVRAEPGQSASAQVMFTLPPDMKHRAVVATFKGVTALDSGAGPKATTSLSALFTFKVSEQVSLVGRLDARPPSGSSNATFASTLTNDGTEPVVPTGALAVMDSQGRMVGRASFSSRRFLPGESDTLIAEYAADLDSGSYRAIATFDIDGKPLTLIAPLLVP